MLSYLKFIICVYVINKYNLYEVSAKLIGKFVFNSSGVLILTALF